jgi:hypothetical protein
MIIHGLAQRTEVSKLFDAVLPGEGCRPNQGGVKVGENLLQYRLFREFNVITHE